MGSIKIENTNNYVEAVETLNKEIEALIQLGENVLLDAHKQMHPLSFVSVRQQYKRALEVIQTQADAIEKDMCSGEFYKVLQEERQEKIMLILMDPHHQSLRSMLTSANPYRIDAALLVIDYLVQQTNNEACSFSSQQAILAPVSTALETEREDEEILDHCNRMIESSVTEVPLAKDDKNQTHFFTDLMDQYRAVVQTFFLISEASKQKSSACQEDYLDLEIARTCFEKRYQRTPEQAMTEAEEDYCLVSSEARNLEDAQKFLIILMQPEYEFLNSMLKNPDGDIHEAALIYIDQLIQDDLEIFSEGADFWPLPETKSPSSQPYTPLSFLYSLCSPYTGRA
jgi:hypothetical protein